jgi:hypothetical protein
VNHKIESSRIYELSHSTEQLPAGLLRIRPTHHVLRHEREQGAGNHRQKKFRVMVDASIASWLILRTEGG